MGGVASDAKDAWLFSARGATARKSMMPSMSPMSIGELIMCGTGGTGGGISP
jgi:hypothetical protein